MLIRSPICVELMAALSILLLLVGLLDKGVLQELGPGQALAWCLIEKALEEGLELGRHVVRKLNWVLNNQVDQRIDTVGVEGWRAHEQFVNDDTQGPEVDRMIVWQLLDQLWSHV